MRATYRMLLGLGGRGGRAASNGFDVFLSRRLLSGIDRPRYFCSSKPPRSCVWLHDVSRLRFLLVFLWSLGPFLYCATRFRSTCLAEPFCCA